MRRTALALLTLVLCASAGVLSAAVLAAGPSRVFDTIDQTRRYANVRGDGEALTGDAGAAIDRCAVAVSAELVGLCQRAMEMGVAFVDLHELIALRYD